MLIFSYSCNQKVEDESKLEVDGIGTVDENELEKIKGRLEELLFEKEFYDNQKKGIEEAIEILDLNIKSNSPDSYYLEFKLKVKGKKIIKFISLEYYDSEVGRTAKNFDVHFVPNKFYSLKFEDPQIPSPLAYSQKIEKEKKSIEENKLDNEERIRNSKTRIVSTYFGPKTKVERIIFDDDSVLENKEYVWLLHQINALKETIDDLEKKKSIE